ncbi:hypothetical protein SDC9_129636 [bioreactor metagenome]|uniref:Uncharacterized protein n=1 Tax=bioreactor metagenome TaxID=1076179 RepID=A0A645D0D4_9ZZZZ
MITTLRLIAVSAFALRLVTIRLFALVSTLRFITVRLFALITALRLVTVGLLALVAALLIAGRAISTPVLAAGGVSAAVGTVLLLCHWGLSSFQIKLGNPAASFTHAENKTNRLFRVRRQKVLHELVKPRVRTRQKQPADQRFQPGRGVVVRRGGILGHGAAVGVASALENCRFLRRQNLLHSTVSRRLSRRANHAGSGKVQLPWRARKLVRQADAHVEVANRIPDERERQRRELLCVRSSRKGGRGADFFNHGHTQLVYLFAGNKANESLLAARNGQNNAPVISRRVVFSNMGGIGGFCPP